MGMLKRMIDMAHEERFEPVLHVLRGLDRLPVIGHARASVAGLKLRALADRLQDIEKACHLAFSFSYLGVDMKPLQVKEEIAELLGYIDKMKPNVVLEIGTATGGTLFLLSRVADSEAKLVSIDLPGGPFGGDPRTWKPWFFKSFVRNHQEIHFIKSDSHLPSTVSRVKDIIGNRNVDFLFIDADHTYAGVKRDFEMYRQLVRKGGIIALHDIVPHPPETGIDIHRFWQEIKGDFKSIEIVEDWGQEWAGIGVVFVT